MATDDLDIEHEFGSLGSDEDIDIRDDLLADINKPSTKSPLKKEVEFNNSANDEKHKIDLLMDLPLKVAIELGRTKMFVKDILDLDRGSIVEFGKLAGEPVDLLINERKMAEGEVVVIDKHFGIRITSIVDPEQLLYKMH
jgi:flagellar motor switch protein FliN